MYVLLIHCQVGVTMKSLLRLLKGLLHWVYSLSCTDYTRSNLLLGTRPASAKWCLLYFKEKHAAVCSHNTVSTVSNSSTSCVGNNWSALPWMPWLFSLPWHPGEGLCVSFCHSSFLQIISRGFFSIAWMNLDRMPNLVIYFPSLRCGIQLEL